MSLPWNTNTTEESTGWKTILKEKLLIPVIGVLSVVLLPYFHLGFLYSYWTLDKAPVNQQSCTCNCWDTLFKGNYERGVGRYKHVYFNLTSNTLVIWAWTALYAFAFYESICYLLRLYTSGRLRFSMFAVYCAAIYPHYYGWWMYFNYANDDYYVQWNHQTFFSITEMISTLTALYLCDKRRETQPRYLLAIIAIAVLHILASSGDQFIRNVILGGGQSYQVFRDIGFMLPDLLNALIALVVWYQFCRRKAVPFMSSVERAELGVACLSVIVLLFVCSSL